MCANVPRVGGDCGLSDGGRSSSQGIGAGASGRSTYRADDMNVSERLTGTSREPLIALSSLNSLRISNILLHNSLRCLSKQLRFFSCPKLRLTYKHKTTLSSSFDFPRPSYLLSDEIHASSQTE
jgi:hypothetical protein